MAQSEAEKLVKEVSLAICNAPWHVGSGHEICADMARAATTVVLERCATLVANLPCCELRRTDEDRPERLFEYGAGAQSRAIEKAIRSLSPEAPQPEAKEAREDE